MRPKAGIFKFNFAEMFKTFSLLLTLFTASISEAQLRNMFGNIAYDLKQEKNFFVGLDGKNSIIKDVPIKLFGLQAGFLYNKRTNLCFGFYTSYNDEAKIYNPTALPESYDTNTVWQKYKLSYVNIACEYYFHDSRHWRFSIPFGIGLGGGADRKRKLSGLYDFHSKTVMPLELGFRANYKITWWLWVSAGMGTRMSLASTRYNGSYYSFGLSLKTGAIYRRVRDWSRREK